MFGLLDENNVLIQKQPNEQEGFVSIPADAVCGQVLENGIFVNPPASPPTLEQQRRASMLAGIEFEGVMCSAHKEDQWGLDSVKDYVVGGMDIKFEFKNGNLLVLTSANIAAFEAVWLPFRLAHTKVNFQP